MFRTTNTTPPTSNWRTIITWYFTNTRNSICISRIYLTNEICRMYFEPRLRTTLTTSLVCITNFKNTHDFTIINKRYISNS